MNSAVIIAITLVSVILVAVLVLMLTIKIQSAARRRKIEGFGRQSEERVDAMLKKAFGNDAVFSGVFLPYKDSAAPKHAEIDHLVVTRSGICVIEVKSHNGQIRCPDEKYWWQTYNDKKISFYNPLWQNKTHTRVVTDILKSEGQYNVPITSVVVFTSRKVTFSRDIKYVIKLDELVNFIKKSGRKNALSTAQTRRIRSIITHNAVKDRSVARRHRSNMRKADSIRGRNKRYK